MKQYHVSREENEIGPFTTEEIAAKVKSGELSLMDFVYDEEQADWVAIAQFAATAELLVAKKPKPKAPPKAENQENAEIKPDTKVAAGPAKKAVGAAVTEQAMQAEWYILKGENKFGPFGYVDVLKMLQQKIVFEFDFAWHPGLGAWKRIAELESFSAESISKVKETLMPEINEVFFRRKHRRVEFNGSVLITDNAKVWKGQGVEVSSGGVGIVIENSLLVPGDELVVHFKPAGGIPAFNASCEVVSKKFVDGLKEKNAPVKYGLKFTGINKQMQEMLADFSKHAAPSVA